MNLLVLPGVLTGGCERFRTPRVLPSSGGFSEEQTEGLGPTRTPGCWRNTHENTQASGQWVDASGPVATQHPLQAGYTTHGVPFFSGCIRACDLTTGQHHHSPLQSRGVTEIHRQMKVIQVLRAAPVSHLFTGRFLHFFQTDTSRMIRAQTIKGNKKGG